MTDLILLPQPLIRLIIWKNGKGWIGAYIDGIKLGVVQIQLLDDFNGFRRTSMEEPLHIADVQVLLDLDIANLRVGAKIRVTFSKNQRSMYHLVEVDPTAEVILVYERENRFSLVMNKGFDLKLSNGLRLIKPPHPRKKTRRQK